jgi:hypothetical protein
MPGQDRKHGPAAKAAVAHAINVQGMTAEQVVILAAAGKLKVPGRRERCRPFPIAQSTVKEYARLARRRMQAKTNGHHEDAPAVALAVRDATVSGREPEHRPDPWKDPNLDPRLRALVERIEDYNRALAEGERCECDGPQPSPYDTVWKPEGELVECMQCNLPTPNRKDTYGRQALRPQSPGEHADRPEAARLQRRAFWPQRTSAESVSRTGERSGRPARG